MEPSHDVIVVGARVAGAATAMLLARQGLRVLVVDRDRYGTDTLSTHALMRGSVFLLSRWGVLDRVIEAGTPPVRQTRFDYGSDSVTVSIKPTPGVEALYAPRRTVLDRVLVDAAEAAGAEIRYGISVAGLLSDGSGRIVGIHGRDRAGTAVTARAHLTIGADGVRSVVAREAGAATLKEGTGSSAIVYGYWSQLGVEGYEWFYRPGHSAGVIPTNAGEACVFAGLPAHHFTRGDLRATYHRMLAAATGGAGGRFAEARPPSRLHTWIGRPGYVRQAHGAGWALVGDAGSFLDPLSTHGITDALRDAETLARCLIRTGTFDDLDEFVATRDEVIEATFEVVDRVAGYGWDLPRLRRHLLDLSSAMSTELDLIATPMPAVG
ncbi:MAG TPA: NAD(P)/FAD-dependent oxidoreductase [Dermatophilaceae bacterium]|nr:NAD(P)/FAD-dependent oxidoreductase [Dermatophilaceae bacterium]